MKKQISVTVSPDLSPRIENWLDGRDIFYEVELVQASKSHHKLKIVANFSEDKEGLHQADLYKKFLERLGCKKGGK